MALVLEILRGASILGCVEAVAGLRIQVFREFPYLYDGDLDSEKRYLRTYSQSPDSLMVLAKNADRVVGASTALPLTDADPQFQKPFEAAGFDPASIFYFGESVLLPEYRGQGTGHRFFQEREAVARTWGATWTCFCAVDRPIDHPLRPVDFRSPESLWKKRGYEKRPELQCSFPWKVIGEAKEATHTLTFWIRRWS